MGIKRIIFTCPKTQEEVGVSANFLQVGLRGNVVVFASTVPCPYCDERHAITVGPFPIGRQTTLKEG